MSQPEFVAEDWYRALRLAERAGLLRLEIPFPSPSAGESERARRHLDFWKKQPPFDRDDWLTRRLALDGLDEASLARLVAVSPGNLGAALGGPAKWLTALEEAYSPPEWPAADSLPLSESARNDPMTGFLNLVVPLVHRALGSLRAGIGEIARAGDEACFDPPAAERLLFSGLPQRLLWMLDRTLVLELNVARLEGRLAGSTPEERFANFADSLRRREVAMIILREYPVLARQLVECMGTWVDTSLEFLRRLVSDGSVIRSTFFGGKDPGRLTEVQAGAGDSHHGGRSVMILRFEGDEKLVYKPRSLSVDVHFQELLEWLNRRGDHPPFRLLKVLDRKSHGWIEFVSPEPCASEKDVHRYHVRLGGLLAVLYAIGAVDFHFENLIAAADQPVPVDLETLFHPRVPRAESENPDERLAVRVLGESVLRVGLLPFRVGESEKFAGSDLSGVASVEGKPSADRMLQWERSGSDEMTAVRKRLTMSAGKNRPTLEGKEVDAAEHIGKVAEGFQSVYGLLVRRREELLAPESPIARFAEDPTRAVLRSTRAYGLLLEESFHPDLLRDALDRDRFFDRIWVGIDEFPAIERIARFEHLDLWRGDVPYFGARAGSTDLWTDTGDRLASFFPEASLAEVRRRIDMMGEDDLFRQTWLTRISLGTLLLNRYKGDWPGFSLADPGEPALESDLRARLVTAALRLGEWFDRMAVRDENYLTWVGLDLRNQVWSLYPMPEDLYAGTPGIALFLGYLTAVTGEKRFAEMARRGMKTLLARLERMADQVPNIGMFQGWGGTIYSLAHLGALCEDPGILAEAEGLSERIADRVGKDTYLDVVAGSAGAIAALLTLHRVNGSKRSLEVARKCGERLLETAKPNGAGISWLTEIGGDEPQTGFSHGAAGIALALVELAAMTGDERFKSAGRAAFVFEREHVWKEIGEWMEGSAPRTASEKLAAAEKAMAMSWCYGAPGEGLARLKVLRHLEDPSLREELDRSVALTLERGFGKNHSLCHGDLGNLDLILQVYRDRGDAKHGEALFRLTRAILASVEKDGWICGTVANIEAPGLMNGLAGIGYGLLRIAHPDLVPSVLVMEPPPGEGIR